MSTEYYVQGDSIPSYPLGFFKVEDGAFVTPKMDPRDAYTVSFFTLTFCDILGNPVTPTEGTIEVFMAPFESAIMAASQGDTVIKAIEVIASPDVSTYNIPVFEGPSEFGLIKLVGIKGAELIKARFTKQ